LYYSSNAIQPLPGSQSNGGVAGRDLSLHQPDGRGNTREEEYERGHDDFPPPTINDVTSVYENEVAHYNIGGMVKGLGM
jgi:hypothetical protein